MMKFAFRVLLIRAIIPLAAFAQSGDTLNSRQVVIEWPNLQSTGTIEVLNGNLAKLEIIRGNGKVKRDSVALDSRENVRILVSLTNVYTAVGSNPTIVTVNIDQNPFSFFLRDVGSEYPIFIPQYHVVVTVPSDSRSYGQIEAAIKKRGGRTRLQQIEREPEETFDSAAIHTRNQPCPTWLGLSRDMRIFELSDNRTTPASDMFTIRPKNGSSPVRIPELDHQIIEYNFMVGRGQGASISSSRRLEEGVLPILHGTVADGEIAYHSTAFVALEKSPLTAQSLAGTDFLVADESSGGHMFTEAQKELVKPRLEAERNRTESTVLCYRSEATNTAAVPRYAWFKTVRPDIGQWRKVAYAFDGKTGMSSFPSGSVFCISRLNGQPLHDEEIAILLKPGGKAVFEFVVPHTPLGRERAAELSRQSFEIRHDECRRFWKEKLEEAAQIDVPERRVNEMIRAGLLQLDMITYGTEPDGTLAPTIGVYSPIGTESSPIIQFFSSMGLSDIARRCLMFFLDKQHDDGMIQNFNGYMVETGAALWSMGEYFRYTGDKEWVRRVTPGLMKAGDFLLRWREGNMKAESRGRGFGMISGKVADPEDPFHQYMLNAYAFLGISRLAEMLRDVDGEQSKRFAREAESWKQDIRASLARSIAHSPVVPLGDGRWSPTVPPWPEATGPRALHISPESYYSHGTVTAPDVLLGPLYLVFCEVLAPEEPAARMMLEYQSELFLERNAAFSQPYYSRHDWVQLKLGMVKPFLKSYYNAMSALADRETYTFWEHLFQVSPHKTHEQAWFLMETRWMLYLEEGRTLKLLPGIPRAWMEDGKHVRLENVRSYFGPISLRVDAHVKAGFIEAAITCKSGDQPRSVTIRLPHPEGKKAIRVTGGSYDPLTETIVIKDFAGTAHVRAEF